MYNKEYRDLVSLLKEMPRSPLRLAKLFEADCEILKLGSQYLCTSTDSIGEEIDLNLYQDPELWGWMTVMSSVSDLATSGAAPLGILIANQWKYRTSNQLKKKFFAGVKKALKVSRVPLLGGDSGNGESHCHTSSILGISKTKPLTRLGIKKNDVLCLLGKKQTGLGPSLAFRILFQKNSRIFPESYFRPAPLLQNMIKLRPYVRASIDTSDGIATSLQILSSLNKVGFHVIWNEHTISPLALNFCKKINLHPLMLWMSDLGDLQSLVAIPEKKLVAALKKEPLLIPIARAVPLHEGITIQFENKKFQLPVEKITNCPRDIKSLRKVMVKMNQNFNKLSRKT